MARSEAHISGAESSLVLASPAFKNSGGKKVGGGLNSPSTRCLSWRLPPLHKLAGTPVEVCRIGVGHRVLRYVESRN